MKSLRLCLRVLRGREGKAKEGKGRKGREGRKEENLPIVWELKSQ
ncbi:hypothetical protein MtrunA17_Chr5g0402591 [Medicago truncatula]|uniref:Uncharacterized protein n=1 Tax=Medicago truncatula TaxID=3880 RepID=A0A396HNP5_MEDTR|nr:hypothetical protein MtrunA17_Chr5g0402591 [Medicago truncatula]